MRWTNDGIEYEADPKHRRMILEYFGFEKGTEPGNYNGNKEDKEEEWEFEELGSEEATIFRGLAARIKFPCLDNPDRQYPAKVCSKEMAKPLRGSWKGMKKVGRYLAGCGRVVWNLSRKINQVLPGVFGQ